MRLLLIISLLFIASDRAHSKELFKPIKMTSQTCRYEYSYMSMPGIGMGTINPRVIKCEIVFINHDDLTLEKANEKISAIHRPTSAK